MPLTLAAGSWAAVRAAHAGSKGRQEAAGRQGQQGGPGSVREGIEGGKQACGQQAGAGAGWGVGREEGGQAGVGRGREGGGQGAEQLPAQAICGVWSPRADQAECQWTAANCSSRWCEQQVQHWLQSLTVMCSTARVVGTRCAVGDNLPHQR